MLDLMIAQSRIDSYLSVYRTLFAANVGGEITVFILPIAY